MRAKYLLLMIIVLFISNAIKSQTVVLQETFESTPLNFTSSSSGSTGSWSLNTRIQSQGLKSDSARVVIGDTVRLTSNTFSTVGNSNVYFEFDHICKIEFMDYAKVEVSNNGGATWTQLTSVEYLGAGQFGTAGNKFSSVTYVVEWIPGNDNLVPLNTMWKHESFNISALIGSTPNAKVRFTLYDGDGDGPQGNAGWFMDNVKVTASFSELTPPIVTFYNPIVPDTNFSTLPSKIIAKIQDLSGVDSAYLFYNVNGGNWDSVFMVKSLPDTFKAYIPFPGFGRDVNYYVKAKDNSAAKNIGTSITKSYFCKYSTGGTSTIGTGTGSSTLYTLYGSSQDVRTQHLYTAQEIIAGGIPSGGNITSLAFYIATGNTSTFNNFTISIKSTSATSISTLDTSNLTLVYTTNFVPSTVGWNTFNFTTPFMWDGVSNIIINYCFNNTTTVTSPSLRYTSSSGKFVYKTSSVAGTSGCDLVGGTASTYRLNIKLTTSPPPALTIDAGFGLLVNPSGAIQANTNTNIVAKIKNFGTDTLISATVNWKIDGVAQTPFLWTGQLLKDSLSTAITLGVLNVPVGNHSFEIWTTNPNGQGDLNWGNDKFTLNFYACASLFSGSYTIGASGYDFTSISNAILALNQCGIAGPVTFNIAPGTYTGQTAIPSIIGSSSTNAITFQSANGDSTGVILSYAATGTSDNYVISFNSTANITFKGLTLKALDPTYARVVQFVGSDSNITIKNCILEGTNTTSTDLNQVILMINTNYVANLNLLHNKFINGRVAINYVGTPAGSNITIKYNNFHNQIQRPVYLNKINNLDFGYNRLFSDATRTANGGFFITNLTGLWKIYNNTFINLGGNRVLEGWVNTGIAVGQEALIYNNYLYSGSASALYVFDGGGTYKYVKFLHNTFAGSVTGVLVNFNNYYGCNDYVTFKDNILSGTGKLLHVSPSATSGSPVCSSNFANYTFDYNDYYTPGTTLATFNGTTCATLAALKAATGQEANSVAINPVFASAGDPHFTNFNLKGLGIPVPEVIYDIDNQLRSTTVADMGCDEYILYSNDAGVFSLAQASLCSGINDVKVNLKNFGINTLTSATINWSINGTAQTPVNFSGSIPSLGDTNLVLGSYNFSNSSFYALKFWTSSPNGNSDGNVQNDTLLLSNFHTSLSGTYTVGGTSADFATPVNAISAVNTFGICGPTVLNINPGTYNGRLTIGNYIGASSVNTLTIKSLNNDTTAIITDSATSASNNWIVKLNGAKYVTLQSLTFAPKNLTLYNNCLVISGQSKYNTIKGNLLLGTTTSGITTDLALLRSEDYLNVNNSIIGNRFYKGSMGIYMKGTAAATTLDSVYIFRNNIKEFSKYGIRLEYTKSPNIDSNIVHTSSATSEVHGISISYAWDLVRITRNSVYISGNVTNLRGIDIGNLTATAAAKGLIANNFITLSVTTSTSNAYGIRLYPNVVYTKVAYNSILVNAAIQNDTRGINATSQCNNIEVISNNVVCNNFPTFYEGSSVIYSDYNNFYSTNNKYAYYTTAYQLFATQAALSAAMQKDSNTISVNPYYPSAIDLHTQMGALNGIAKVLPEVSIDIDGESRSVTIPDIGADEFTPSPYDIKAEAIINPESTNCGLTNQESITLRIKNDGSATVNGGFSATYKVGVNTPVTEPIADTIQAGMYKDYTFTTKANLSTGAATTDQTFNLKAWVSLSSDQIHVNDTTNKTIISGYTPAAPTSTGAFTANYATTPVITATSTDTLAWFSTDTATTALYVGKWFTTPQLYDTTTFYVGAKSMTGLNCVSSRMPVDVNIINYPQNDAGVTAITDPVTNIPSKINHALKVDLKNYGLATLTSAKIYYSLNGLLTDSLLWTGSLTHGSTTNVGVDSLYLAGGIYTLKVWSSVPNNQADLFHNNDTTSFQFNACLQGTYTLGQTPNVTYDFPSFTAARNALVTAGICGNVTILVDTGVYSERMSWNPIPGAGPNAVTTFTAMNGDSTSVTLRYTLSSAAAWAMKFIGSSYITMKNMTMSVSGSTTWGRIMEIANGSHHIKIENCVLEGLSGANSGINFATLYMGGSANNNYNVIRNNKIIYGYYGVYFVGMGTTNWSKGNIIEGNKFSNVYYNAIYVKYHDSIQINKNIISNGNSTSTQYGIYAYYCNNGYRITNNEIYLNGSYNYGIRDDYNNYYLYNANPSAYGLVANNIISLQGGTSNYGLYLYYSAGTEFIHNSIKIKNSTIAYGVYQYNTSSNTVGQSFKNNIYENSGMGYCIYIGTPAKVASSDYNNYYNPGSNVAYWTAARSTLSDLQSASGKDAHSVSIQPPFFSNSNLRLQSTSLSAKGIAIPKVPTDIDGELRGAVPTIGADEVPLLPIDGGVSTILIPATVTFEFDTIYPKIIVCNYGLDTLFTIPISYTVNNGTPVTYNYSDTLIQYQCDTVVLPYFISPAGNCNLCVKTIIVGDSNAFNDQSCKNFFGTPSKDAVASRILKLDEGCGLTTDSVKLVIRNIGGLAINGGISASYQVNGGSIINQAVTDSIAVNDSITFTFNTPINLSVTTTDVVFDVKAWVNYSGDNVSYNDTAFTSTKSMHTPPTPIVSNVSIPFGTPISLSATSTTNDSIVWYDSLYGGSKLHEGNIYTTPTLFTNDTFFVSARGGGPGGVVILGNGTSTNSPSGYPTPYGNYYWGNKEQYLVTAQELTALGAGPGAISKLGFDVANVNSCPGLSNYYISIAHTNQTVLTSWVSGTFTNCFATALYQPVNGWNEHIFQNPFIWNGSDNIVIEVCFNNSSWVSLGNASVKHTTTSVNTVARYNGDNANVCSSPAYTSFSSSRPNMMIDVAPTGCSSARVPLKVTVGSPSAIDAGVKEITNPVSAIYMSSQETVKVKIRNYGTTALSNFSVSYKIDSLTTITETVAGPLASQDSMTYTFSTKANFGIMGQSYQIKAWVHPVGDATALNDTASTVITHLIPSYCNSAATSNLYYDIANVTFGGLNNTSPSPYSALYTDYTNLTGASISPGNIYPISISIQTTNTSVTAGYCKVFIDYNRDGIFTTSDETAFSSAFAAGGQIISGNVMVPSNALNGYSQMRVVAVYNGNINSVLPCATYSYGETEDYTIMISPRISQDAGVELILNPTAISNNNIKPLNLQIRNYGLDTISSVNVSYVLNSGNPNTITHSASIYPGDSALVSFGNITLAQGQNTICAYTTLLGDSNVFNNQKCITTYLQAVTTIPYFDNFETADLWFPDTIVNQWQRGVPQMPNINTAYSPVNVWGVNLTGNYANNSHDRLYTPKFVIPNNIDSFYIKFWQKLNTQSANDGGYIEYKTNSSPYWLSLGYLGDPAATNWFTHNVGGTNMWTGDLGWQQSTYLLNVSSVPADTIQFRFIFKSNASTNTYSGWAIDNFEIKLPPIPYDAGVVAINSPSNAAQMGSVVTVVASIKNHGTSILTSIPVSYQVNGSVAVNDVFTPAGSGLKPDSVAQFTFGTSFNAPIDPFNICVKTNVAGDAYYNNDEMCDSISILPANLDVAVTNIEAIPTFGNDTTKFSYNTQVRMTIRNNGTTTLTSVPVEFKMGVASIGNETWTGTLLPDSITTYLFTQTYKSPIGSYSLSAISHLVGDPNATNDMFLKVFVGVYDMVIVNTLNARNFSVDQNIPNPAYGMTHINYFVPTQGKVSFELRNSLGQNVMQQEVSASTGDNVIEMDAKNLSHGVYYYTLTYDNQTITRKLVVSK